MCSEYYRKLDKIYKDKITLTIFFRIILSLCMYEDLSIDRRAEISLK